MSEQTAVEVSALQNAPVPSAEGIAFGTVDCDVHPHLKDGLRSLHPYLTDAWRRRLLGASSAPGKGMDVYASQFTLPRTTSTSTRLGRCGVMRSRLMGQCRARILA